MTRKSKSYIDPEKYEIALNLDYERHSLANYEAALRDEDHGADTTELARLADILRPVLLFVAKGSGLSPKNTTTTKRGTLDIRAWAVLYVVRPDLIGGESMNAAAKRFGVSKIYVRDVVQDLLAGIPRFKHRTSKVGVYGDELRQERSAAAREQWARRRRAASEFYSREVA